MSYYIDYSELDNDPVKKEQKAINDSIYWLGGKREFNKLIKKLNKLPQDRRDFAIFGLAMNGIQGYPAEVILDKYWTGIVSVS